MSTTKRERKFSQYLNGESQTQQQFKDECDINNIVRRYTQTGMDPNPGGQQKQTFGFATSQDFAESAFRVAEITSAFEALPSGERAHFRNNPELWLDALNTPEPTPPENAPPEASDEPSEPATEPPKSEPPDII